jgi:hypothetical protein
VRYDLPLMPIGQTSRINSRDAHPFPGEQVFGQTQCLVIPQATGLLGLRLLSVYRSGDGIGVGCKGQSARLFL